MNDAASASLEERVAALEAIEDIKRLKAHYAALCDKGYDPDGIAALCTEDCVWSSNSFGTFAGRAEIRGFFAGISSQIQWAMHFMICPVIELAPGGEEASGSWYLLELATMAGTEPDAPADAVVMTGNYVDRYVRVDGAWRFANIQIDFHQVSNLDRGWVRQPFRGQ
jgi:hypothetical protein